jgi:Zn-dependent M16 (insulinase) family peptidase
MSLLHGFELLKEQKITELNTTAILYRHERSGARLLSLENDDENKVFGITFRTPPADSTGIAHILEHAALCGSRRYPVKEPFVELLKGSLNTFVNAFTYPDKTCYPFASQNSQDFYNLLDIYLDAVFYPKIDRFMFQQEGWHYELENLQGPLTYKGIVYNEMKGAYSSPDDVLDDWSRRALFPDTLYGLDSGGDPACIPDLSYEQFLAFHRAYYHPSNSWIYFWGNDEPQERLRRLDEYLKDFDYREAGSRIPLQPAFAQPQRRVVLFDTGEPEEEPKQHISLNWGLDEKTDMETVTGLQMLSEVLLGNSASPLRRILTESKLGEEVVGHGADDSLRQMVFSVGMKGVAEGDLGQVEELILSTLEQLSDAGIDEGTVSASLNTFEFDLRESNTGRFPRGLIWMLRGLTTWLYDGDPLTVMAFEAPLQVIKGRVRGGERYFEGLIRQYLLENPHRATVVLMPDPQLAERRASEEAARLESVWNRLDDAAREQILGDNRELKRRQQTPDSPEALATIPVLKLSDLERKFRPIPCEKIDLSGVEVLVHDLFTNGVFYIELGFDLHSIPQAWLPYLPLFGRSLTEMGTKKEDFVTFLQRIGRSTGGVHAGMLNLPVRGQDRGSAWMFLRGKSMLPQAGEMFAILRDILFSARLDDRERLRQMALETRAAIEGSLADAGNRVASGRVKSSFNETYWLNEVFGGVEQLFFLRGLLDQIEHDWPAVQVILYGIRDRLINHRSALVNVTVDAAGFEQVRSGLAALLSELPIFAFQKMDWKVAPRPAVEGLSIPATVNFVAKAGDIYAAGYQMHGSALPIVNYLNNTWLWQRIRVMGGAYSGGCNFDRHTGVFNFVSYRDPNLIETLDIYDKTSEFLACLEIDEAEITRSIIGAIGELDTYLLPDAKGFTSLARWLAKVSDEDLQRQRDEVLGTKAADFHHLGDALHTVREHGRVAVVGDTAALKAVEAKHPGWMNIVPVL